MAAPQTEIFTVHAPTSWFSWRAEASRAPFCPGRFQLLGAHTLEPAPWVSWGCPLQSSEGWDPTFVDDNGWFKMVHRMIIMDDSGQYWLLMMIEYDWYRFLGSCPRKKGKNNGHLWWFLMANHDVSGCFCAGAASWRTDGVSSPLGAPTPRPQLPSNELVDHEGQILRCELLMHCTSC